MLTSLHADSDSRIYDPAALAWREGEDRIQVEFADLRESLRELIRSNTSLIAFKAVATDPASIAPTRTSPSIDGY